MVKAPTKKPGYTSPAHSTSKSRFNNIDKESINDEQRAEREKLRQELNDELAKFGAKVLEDMKMYKQDPSSEIIMLTNNLQGYVTRTEIMVAFSKIALSFEDLMRCAAEFTKGAAERKLLHKVKDTRSLPTLKSMQLSLFEMTRKLIEEYEPWQITIQMIAMVLYEWIDEYRKGSMINSIRKKYDIHRANVNELIVYSP